MVLTFFCLPALVIVDSVFCWTSLGLGGKLNKLSSLKKHNCPSRNFWFWKFCSSFDKIFTVKILKIATQIVWFVFQQRLFPPDHAHLNPLENKVRKTKEAKSRGPSQLQKNLTPKKCWKVSNLLTIHINKPGQHWKRSRKGAGLISWWPMVRVPPVAWWF